MADQKKSSKEKVSSKAIKPKQTVRERTRTDSTKKPRRLKGSANKLGSGLKRSAAFGKREYHIPLPDNKAGRILKKRVKIRIFPKFIRESWAEIRLVKWPNRRETRRLTIAVLIFSLIFGISVSLLDIGLDKLFKEVIIKK